MLRAVVLSGVYLSLLALFGLGIGAIARRSAGAIAAYAGLVLVLPYALLALPGNLARFAPETMLASSVAAVRPQPHYLPPGWAGVAVMALYTAVTLVVGGWLLAGGMPEDNEMVTAARPARPAGSRLGPARWWPRCSPDRSSAGPGPSWPGWPGPCR